LLWMVMVWQPCCFYCGKRKVYAVYSIFGNPIISSARDAKKNWKSVAFGVVAGLIRKLISVVLQEQGYITHVIFRKIKTPIVIHLLT